MKEITRGYLTGICIMLIFLVGILFIGVVSAYSINTFNNGLTTENINVPLNSTPCYQETANISTACGGLSNGTYAFLSAGGSSSGGYNRTNNIPATPNSNSNEANIRGEVITMTNTTYILNVTRVTGADATELYIYNGSDSLLGHYTTATGVWIVNLAVTNGATYKLGINKTSGTSAQKYVTGASYPQTSVEFDWVDGIYSGLTPDSTTYNSFESITTGQPPTVTPGDEFTDKTEAYDGIWDSNSNGAVASGSLSAVYQVNYSRPVGTNLVVWKLQLRGLVNYPTDNITEKNINYSITIPNDCLLGTIALNVTNIRNASTTNQHYFTESCYNTTAWKQIGIQNNASLTQLNEEAVYIYNLVATRYLDVNISKTASFGGNPFFTRAYLNISSVDNSTQNLTLKIGETISYTLRPSQYSFTSGFSSNTSNAVDNDWSTYTSLDDVSQTTQALFNYTLPYNTSNAIFNIKTYSVAAGSTGVVSCYNFTSNGWVNFVNLGGGAIVTNSTTIPYECTVGNKLVTIINMSSTGFGSGFRRLYETNVSNITTISSSNPTVWNFTGIFNQSNNRTQNLAAYLNAYLRGSPYSGQQCTNDICSIPFVFTSDTNGTFRYNGLLFDTEGFLENSQTYNPTSNPGSTEQFYINLTYNSLEYSIAAIFTYNNTNYSSTQLSSGSEATFNSNLVIPSIFGSTRNNTFYWNILLTNSTGTFYYRSTNHNQTISQINVDNCLNNTQRLINATLYDQDNMTMINGTIEFVGNIYSADRTVLIRTFNQSYTGNNAQICMAAGVLNSTNFSMDYQFKFYSSGYFSQFIFAQNITLSNSTVPYALPLYDLLSTSGQVYNIVIRDSNFRFIDGAVVSIQRQYIPINQFVQVEAPLSDNSGQVSVHLISNTQLYNIVVMKNNQVIAIFANQVASCASNQCTISLNEPSANIFLEDVTQSGGLNVAFSNTSTTLNMIFNTLDGNPSTVAWNVIKNDGYGNTTICSQSGFSSVGTYTCAIPSLYVNSSIIAYVYNNGQLVTTHYSNYGPSSNDIFGGTRVLLAILMYTTLALLFISNSTAMIIGAVLGMIFAIGFHVVDGGSFGGNGWILGWFIIGAGIILWQIREANRY